MNHERWQCVIGIGIMVAVISLPERQWIDVVVLLLSFTVSSNIHQRLGSHCLFIIKTNDVFLSRMLSFTVS
jgi:hypothetical protein